MCVRVRGWIVIEEGSIDCGGCCALVCMSIHFAHPEAGGGTVKRAMNSFFCLCLYLISQWRII